MPVDSTASTEVTAFRWVPDFAAGLVRDLRIRWALEEIERPYRIRLLDAMNPRPADYFQEQPFGQVPAYRDDQVQLFESGAILIHLGLQDERLLPADLNQRMRSIAWLIAALNSVEPMIFELINIDIFNRGQEWTKERRPQVVEKIEGRLKLLSEALNDREWFEGRFSIGNMMIVAVLRQLRHTDIVGKFPNLAALMARAEVRPAFQRHCLTSFQSLPRISRSQNRPEFTRTNRRKTRPRRRMKMAYYEGFVVPVPKANREEYRKHAADAAPIFHDLGVLRHVEAWASDVPDGKITDFRKAVEATEDEDVVFSWFEYPDKAARDSANERMMSDPRMQEMGAAMPFDGKRMIMGGFDGIVEEGGSRGGYTDGFVVPVPEANREAYRDMAAKMAKVFQQHGANRIVEAIADDVSHGKVTDFYRAVKAEDGETIVFSFIEWPDKQSRDDAWAKIMTDESLKPDGEMPFNGQRMFWGGFDPIVDSAKSELTNA